MRPFLAESILFEKGFLNMKNIHGVYTSAKIFTDTVEDYALAQIQMLCDNKAFSGSQVRIMPDVHPGKVGTIGFTATLTEKLLPSVVGIDIGCGVLLVRIKQKKCEFQRLDTIIRENVPTGFHIRKSTHRFYGQFDLEALKCSRHIKADYIGNSLGTLGSGNHFIEVDKDDEGQLYLAIHTGSRALGKTVAEYYLNEGQKYLKAQGLAVPYELTWLEGKLMEDYLHDIELVQQFASLNRQAILDEIAKGMKWKISDQFESQHNYVDLSGRRRILRKGAVSAKAGEKVIIPVNMRDGILMGRGKGNPDWNESAPHGAGRLMKREAVKESYTVSQFKGEMKGIYSTCIGRDTLDEAPFAYRGLEMILPLIQDTVDIETRLKPVYNYKAGGR